jgi:hypothetical protein
MPLKPLLEMVLTYQETEKLASEEYFTFDESAVCLLGAYT